MINPDDNFPEDEPLDVPLPANEEQIETGARRAARRTAQKISTAAGETWAQTKQRAGNARERTELFLRENPVPTILGALVVGLVIGLAIRYASAQEEEEKKVEVKTPLGDFSWGFLSLPFLWPFFKSAKQKLEDSAEVVKEGVDRVRNIDVHRYTKPLRKRWKSWTR